MCHYTSTKLKLTQEQALADFVTGLKGYPSIPCPGTINGYRVQLKVGSY